MKISQTSQRASVLAILCVAIALLAGCATAPKVDWGSRIGEYTYDQAVVELGPPSKQAKLADGKVVADWITRTQRSSSFGLGFGGYGSHTGVGIGTSVGGGYPERVLRLTFTAEGKLENCYRN